MRFQGPMLLTESFMRFALLAWASHIVLSKCQAYPLSGPATPLPMPQGVLLLPSVSTKGETGDLTPKASSCSASQRVVGVTTSPELLVSVLSDVPGLPSRPPVLTQLSHAVFGSVE